MKLSDDLQISLTVAVYEAGRLGHEYAGLEHLLYALTLDDDTARGASPRRRRHRPVREDLPSISPTSWKSGVDGEVQPRLTLGVQRVLSLAAARVGAGQGRDPGRGRPGGDVRRAGLLRRQVLESEGVSRLDVVSYLAHGVSRAPRPPYFGGSEPRGTGQPGGDEDDEDEDDRRRRRRRWRPILSRPSPRT